MNTLESYNKIAKSLFFESEDDKYASIGFGRFKLKGKEVPYLVNRLKTYRAGTKVGPNSSLMIMMAQPLSDAEIDNLAAYLSAQK